MNKKILLIENRPYRQREYLPNRDSDVVKLNNLEFLCNNMFDEKLKSIDNDDLTFLLEYNLIIVHRSALSELSNGASTNKVIKFCEDNSKDLILFSGGISNTFYTENKGSLLLINSRDFYKNLLVFLDFYSKNDSVKTIRLLYGENWELAYLLQIREYLKIEEEEYENKINELKDIVGIDRIDWNNLDEEIIKKIESI